MVTSDKVGVLVVDDRAERLLELEKVLADLPVDLVQAGSRRAALRALAAREFAVILLNVSIQQPDGFETARRMRRRKSSGHPPMIFITGCSDAKFISRGYSVGAVDYILEPVAPEILRSKVAVLLELHHKAKVIEEQVELQQQRARQLQKLASASVAINSAQSMVRTLQIITDSARDVIGAHQAITLFLLEEESGGPAKTRAFCSFSEKYADWRGRPMNLDAVAGSVVATSARPTRLLPSELAKHPDYPIVRRLEETEIPPLVGLLAAPIVGRDGQTIGVVYLSDKVAGDFSAEDEAILVQLTQMASVAIQNLLSAQAREANRAKDQFIAVLSHELRTPLTPVLATVASLQTDQRVPDDVQKDIELIRRNVELEARLIDDLLDLTRISKGKIELHIEPVDIHDLLQRAAEICSSDVAEKQIELIVDAAAREHFVKGDATRLQQVFWNLIKNAVKFTPAGGRIVIDSSNTSDGELRVRVSDTGIGIEPDVLPRIFRAFEQGRTSITRQFGGLGLGLAISKALITQHKGMLTATSAGRGKGATFTVALPTTTEAPREGGYTPPRAAPAARSRAVRVLLVEDHRDTARVMAKLLRAHGFVVECAHSCSEAVQALRAATFDVLVSDIGLPDGTGLDLIRMARALQPIAAIALSGYGMEYDLRRSREAGFELHLTKPLNFTLLIESIEKLTAGTEAVVTG